MHDVRGLIANAHYEIAGSFRRGAPWCGDVDLIITGSSWPPEALSLLVQRLHAAHRVSHTVSLSRRDAEGAGDAHLGVDVAEVVYVWDRRVHRRVDLVLASRDQFGAALLAWTGSVTYERDLRRWAKKNGYSVRSAYSCSSRRAALCVGQTVSWCRPPAKRICTCP